MVFINQEEIIEVSSHFFRRRHARIEIKIVPVGKCREDMREHGFLDLGGCAQFGADALLFSGNLGQMICIIHNAVFHGLDFVIQIADFIIGSDIQLDDIVFRKGSVLIGKLCGRIGQLLQRPDRGTPEQGDTGNDCDYQQDGNKDETLPQEHIPLSQDIRHIDIHTGYGNSFSGLRIKDRLNHRTEPAELRVIDDRRNF